MDPEGGGAAATVNASVAVCVNELDLPVNVIVALPVVAFDAAVRVMLCAVPGVRASVDGFAVTPVGRPLRVTFTVPVNPFWAVALMEIG